MINETNWEIIEEGYLEAIECLKRNSTPDGFSATPERHANYYSVWARDHSITALGALLTGDKHLIATAKKGILNLLLHQSDAGQIPSYIEIEKKTKIYGGLGSITSIDSNLWVLICAAEIYKKTKDKRFISTKQIQRYKQIYRLVRAFDSNNCGLMEVHVAGDWADIVNRSYHVLYDECLHYQAFRDLIYIYKEFLKKPETELHGKVTKYVKWVTKRKKLIKPILNKLFWITPQNTDTIKEQYMIYLSDLEPYPFYQTHLMPFKHDWSQRFDTFGNALAIITGIAPKTRAHTIVRYVDETKMNLERPIPALYPVMYPNDTDWEPIYELKEQPHTYHNGGIWPMVTGFWVAGLVKTGKKRHAERELVKLAEVLQKQQWLFAEYLHGESLNPMGRNNQAWSAAGYIFAYHAVKFGKLPF